MLPEDNRLRQRAQSFNGKNVNRTLHFGNLSSHFGLGEAVMFDLEKAIRKWRRGLERGSSLSTRKLDELGDKLRARAELA